MLLRNNRLVLNILATRLAADLFDGTGELFASSKDVVESGEDHDEYEHRGSVVHVRASNRQHRWEWQENDEEDAEADCKDVDREPDLAHGPWSEPDWVGRVEAADSEQDRRNSVGKVETQRRQRDQSVESCGGSNVDQGQNGDAYEEQNHGICGAFVSRRDLGKDSREWDAMISGKGPDQARD